MKMILKFDYAQRSISPSRNLATINLLSLLGLDSVYKELKKDGFKNLSMDLSLALGSFGYFTT